MTELVIDLEGAVVSSNIDEYEREILGRLAEIDTDFSSAAGFEFGARDRDWCKTVEQTGKKAKEHACLSIKGMSELSKRVDLILGEVRDVRLRLGKKIDDRNRSRREQLVVEGLKEISQYINEKDANFRSIDHSSFLNEGRFERAIWGQPYERAGHKVCNLCTEIKREIDSRAVEVNENARRIDGLPRDHQLLLPDRDRLLGLSREELDDLIAARVADAERMRSGSNVDGATYDQSSEIEKRGPARAEPIKERFALILELESSRLEANGLLDELKAQFERHSIVKEIRLERHRSESSVASLS